MLSVSTSGKSRFQGKLDKIFWFIIMILPLVFWLVLNMVPVAVSAETENTEESATVSTVAEEEYTYKMYFTYFSSALVISENLIPGLYSGFSFAYSDYSLGNFNVLCYSDETIDFLESDTLYLRFDNSDGDKYRYSAVPNNPLVFDVSLDFVQFLDLKFTSDGYAVYRFPLRWSLKSADFEFKPESYMTCIFERVPVENKFDSSSLKSVLVNYFGIDMISENSGGIIGDTLYGVFGSTGIFPIFTRDSAMIYYMIYFVYVEILHVLIDILVFIPRFAHKILGKAINFGD